MDKMVQKVQSCLQSQSPCGVMPTLISKDELFTVLNDEEAVRALDKLNIDVLALCEDYEDNVLFDGGQSDGLTFQEFTEVLPLFQSTQGATYRSMSSMNRRIRSTTTVVSNLSDRLASVEVSLRHVVTACSGSTSLPSADNYIRVCELRSPRIVGDLSREDDGEISL